MSIEIKSRHNHIYLDVAIKVDETTIQLGLHSKKEAMQLREEFQSIVDELDDDIARFRE